MKTNRQRFEIIAASRVQKVLNSLDSLKKCSNKKNYEYSDSDIKKMEKALKEKLAEVLDSYSSGLKQDSKKEFKF